MAHSLKDTLKSGYGCRVVSNIVHTDPLPRGAGAPGFYSGSNKGWGSTGHERGKSLKRTKGYAALVKMYEKEEKNGN